jgi:hypothetical protein
LFFINKIFQFGAIFMGRNEHHCANPRAFFHLTNQYQDSKVRQSRMLRRSLDEIKSGSSIFIKSMN